ncbi:biotin transporter BioY, partial [Planktomarina temperata]|nr:biotin transporter BioY [Planktomarina temperata]
MTTQTPSLTLAEAFFPQTGLALRVKQLVLVVAGIAALALAAKIKIPMFP